jgi:hypothetical protein
MQRLPVRVTVTLSPAARRAQFRFRRAMVLNITAVLLCLAVIVPAIWLKSFSAWAPFVLVLAGVLLHFANRDLRAARDARRLL